MRSLDFTFYHFSDAFRVKDRDIVDTAVSAGFNTLVAAVTAADLVDTLKGDGPFTVFAPTDEAFAALPEGTVETLLEPENKDQLTSILTYHVVAGKIMAADLMEGIFPSTVCDANALPSFESDAQATTETVLAPETQPEAQCPDSVPDDLICFISETLSEK